ncbi:hypothetical protein BH09PSE5_BH09PSE5_16940 [soil metagenome]
MIEFITPAKSISSSTQGPDGASPNDVSYGYAADAGPGSVDHLDFQAMLENGDSEGVASLRAVDASASVIDIVRSVDAGKGNAQAALLKVAAGQTNAQSIHESMVALSRYDIQTLFLSKVANKTFQAVDRLTNLQ